MGGGAGAAAAASTGVDADHSHAEGRLFSSYDTEEHGTIWVITEDLRGEAGGPITTVLFPEDY